MTRMCLTWDYENKYKSKCFVVAILSLVVNTFLFILSVLVLIQTKDPSRCGPPGDPHRLCSILTEYFGSYEVVMIDTICCIGGVLGILGIVSSVMLMFGLKRDKPGYLAIYMCYGLQATIVFLLNTLFAFLRSFWWMAGGMIIFFVANIYGLFVVIKVYDTITYTTRENRQRDSTSDLRLLVENE